MARRQPWTWAAAFTAAVLLVAVTAAAAAVKKRLLVDMTLVPDAASTGAGKCSSPSINPPIFSSRHLIALLSSSA
jgi:hypothetical protein